MFTCANTLFAVIISAVPYFFRIDFDKSKETKILNPYPDAYPSGVRLVTGNMMFSYKNPRDWTNLTTEQVAEDILGLSQDWSIV